MNAHDASAILVIGVGNEYRGDDGVGPYVARQIDGLKLPKVAIRIESGEGASLIEAWRDYERVIVIDATSSEQKPGHVHRLDAANHPIPTQFFHYSTHAFSLAEAVELARAMGQLPPQLVVYGIEGKTFAAGCDLSEIVRRVADEVVLQIKKELIEAATAVGCGATP